uniref:Myosin motor domain-containing protein n=1 Tax=Macrostomum lignano TaxID=282301 RepID=A0A1I8GQC5_9PLAT
MRPSADIYDLASLTELSEEAIGKVLQDRYNGDRIYTLVGDILVFLNPFKPVNVYTEKEFSCLSRPDWSGPVAVGNEVGSRAHIYTVGTAAFNLVGKDSTILISGESGSGKTESTKLLLQQFVKMASSSQLNRTRVAECLLAANPIMEAFGNARTVMNHNSSRFAKFVSLGLQGNALVSSEIRTYMLEKSRLLSATEDEGNFHIFYYMCLSSNSFFKDVRPLGPLSLISNAETLGRRYTDLEAKATEVLDAFDKLSFTAQQKEGVFQILSGLLLLADVEFRSEEQNHTVCTSLDPKSETTFKLACKRLGLKGKDSRRRLLKTLTTMNDILASTGRPDPGTRVRQIGVLDIFGFESLAINSFEQLCINLANEQLQLFFTHHVIQLEQAEYQSEGLSWVEIPFEDNQVTLNLFLERPLGVLSLLNEESSLASERTRVCITS